MSVARPGAPADPKVLLKGVKDAQARILKLQEENDQLRQRLTHIDKGDAPADAAKSQPVHQAPNKSAPGKPSRAPPPASVYAQTDIDDKSFLVLDFGGKKPAPPGNMRANPIATPSVAPSIAPSMAPSTVMLQGQQQLRQQQQQQHMMMSPRLAEDRPPSPTTTTATENSMRAFHNPAYVGNQQFTQQEASEWKQMYIETLKHLRATKEAIEQERQAAQQWEQELRTMQVVDDSPASSLPGSPSAGAASAAHTPPSTLSNGGSAPPRPSPQRSATTPATTAAAAAAAVTPVQRTQSMMGGPEADAARVAALRTQSETVPQEFLQKYQQLGLGPPAGSSPQQLPARTNTQNIYVLDPLDHHTSVQTKGPIVYDVRTGMTYTESPSVSKSKNSLRSSDTLNSSSFTSVVSAKLDILGKPKRRIQHTVTRSMASASKGKNAPPWMRNLFSCVNISDTATKM